MKTSIMAIGVVLLITLLSGCVSTNSEDNYYEILLEKDDCDPVCKEEYIVLSNGLILKKLSIEKEIINNEIEIVKIDESKAKEAIEFSQNLEIPSRKNRCIECSEYTFFTLNKGELLMFADTEENTPNEVKQILENSKELFKTGVRQEDFFIQLVYKKLGQKTIDYHLFPNGSILYEEFDDGINLTSARVYTIGEEKLKRIKNLVKPNFFESESSIVNCYTIGFDYGYLEVKSGSLYNFAWTCGTEDSDADELFNELRKEFG